MKQLLFYILMVFQSNDQRKRSFFLVTVFHCLYICNQNLIFGTMFAIRLIRNKIGMIKKMIKGLLVRKEYLNLLTIKKDRFLQSVLLNTQYLIFHAIQHYFIYLSIFFIYKITYMRTLYNTTFSRAVPRISHLP